MTVSTTTNKVSYAGNGSTVAYAFSFPIFAQTDLRVILLDDSTGVETVQTITTHYTVSASPYDSGGTVTMLTPPASGETLLIKRVLDQTQTLDLAENGPLPAESLEDALDRVVMIVQEVAEQIARSIVVSETDTGSVTLPAQAARALKFLSFDGNGDLTVSEGTVGDAVTIASFIEPFLAASTAAAAHQEISLFSARGDIMRANASTNPEALTVGAAETILQSNGTDPSWVDPRASEAEMVTGTDVTQYVTAGRAHFNPGVAKAWVYITTSGGTPSAAKSRNVASLTDNGVGEYQANFTNPMADALSAVIAMNGDYASAESSPRIVCEDADVTKAAGYAAVRQETAGATALDEHMSIAVFGELA